MNEHREVEAANRAFYQAFETLEIKEMEKVWLRAPHIKCVHPGWPALMGRQAILDSYRQILSNPHQDRIEPRNATVMVNGDEARTLDVALKEGDEISIVQALSGG